MTSVLTRMDLTLSAPDPTTVSRRAVTLPMIQPAQIPRGPLLVLIDSTGLEVHGAGQWLQAEHAATSRRRGRKRPLAVDADDPSQVGPRLYLIDDPIGPLTAHMMVHPPTRRSPRTAMASRG